MSSSEIETSTLLFSRAYGYEGFDEWSYPVNRGRLAEALLLNDKVLLHTTGFTEMRALVEELGSRFLNGLLASGRLQFILYPYCFGQLSTEQIPLDIGAVVVVMFENVIKRKIGLDQAIQERLFQTPYEIPDLGPDLLDTIVETTLLAPSEISSIAEQDLAADLLDDHKASEYERVLQDHLHRPYPIRDLFRVQERRDKLVITPQGDMRDPDSRERVRLVAPGLVLLLETAQQVALATWAETDIILTSPLFSAILAAKHEREDLSQVSAANSMVGLETAMGILRLPDLGFLVNRDLVSLEDAISFSNSRNGKRVRSFLREVGSSAASGDLQTEYSAALVENLMPRGKLQQLANSGGLGTVVFAVLQGISFLNPIAGLAASVAEKAAKTAVSREWKLLPVIKKHLVGSVLARDLEREKDRKICYPSLEKLSSQGFAVVMVRWFRESREKAGEVILSAEGGKKRFHVVAKGDRQGEEYLQKAEEMLPDPNSLSGKLLRMLAIGRLVSAELSFGESRQRRIVFIVKSREGTTKVEGDYTQFKELLGVLPHLIDPDKANDALNTPDV